MRKLFITILCLLIYNKSFTQEKSIDSLSNNSIRIINTKSSDHEIIKHLHNTTSKHFHDPNAPRFLLYDQQRKIGFGLGGYVRMRSAYDFNGSPNNSFGFIPNSIPVPMDPITKNRLKMDASKSTLFFKLVGDNSKVGKFQAYLSGSFTGSNNTFVLDDAYISLLGLTIGRTWSIFNDVAVIPPTVDFQGPNGIAEMRTTQISYSNNLSNRLSFGIAAELPQATGTYVPFETGETPQHIPNIPAYIQYKWGKNAINHTRIAGVLLNINYRDLVINKTENTTGYGLQLSNVSHLAPFIKFYGQITYGKGIAQYINDLSGNGSSLIKNINEGGKMKAQEALGWFTQIQFNLSSSIFTTMGYSQARLLSEESSIINNDSYRYGQYVVGNIFYNIGTDFQLGLEYLWGNRVNINKEKASANCIQAMIQFNF